MRETGENRMGKKDAKTDLFTITTYTQRQQRQNDRRDAWNGEIAVRQWRLLRGRIRRQSPPRQRTVPRDRRLRLHRLEGEADFQPVRRTVGRMEKRTDGQARTLRNL